MEVSKAGIITLLTDFGVNDPFVGIIKGVIHRIAPGVEIIDLCHGVPSYSVSQGAMILGSSYRYFPDGTLHVAIVDPGVGSSRRVIFAQSGEYRFLAPDNGILSRVFSREEPRQLISVENRDYFLPMVSSTFHGRDIFAPVAARLIQGLDPLKLGPTQKEMVKIPCPYRREGPGFIEGEVESIDKFGNLTTSIDAGMLIGKNITKILFKDYTIPGLSTSYSEGEEGALLSLINSLDHLEVAVSRGNAAEQLQGIILDRVVVEYEDR
ncbi:MAG: S-adenosyl-l-methionine hydroxide adenosyltransferase family protein [Vulcanimicrobiota bacterium]